MDSPFFFEDTVYWSEGDEAAHFEWLARIKTIKRVYGVGSRLYLEVNSDALSYEDILELKAVYRRYAGDLKQLGSLKEVADAQN